MIILLLIYSINPFQNAIYTYFFFPNLSHMFYSFKSLLPSFYTIFLIFHCSLTLPTPKHLFSYLLPTPSPKLLNFISIHWKNIYLEILTITKIKLNTTLLLKSNQNVLLWRRSIHNTTTVAYQSKMVTTSKMAFHFLCVCFSFFHRRIFLNIFRHLRENKTPDQLLQLFRFCSIYFRLLQNVTIYEKASKFCSKRKFSNNIPASLQDFLPSFMKTSHSYSILRRHLPCTGQY